MSTARAAEFAGAWQRTALYEPHDAADEHEQSSTLVVWLQSPCGLFVDLRRPPPACDLGARSFKSFAGVGVAQRVANERCHFTWTREIDVRPPGAPDVGDMVWLASDTLQGVLMIIFNALVSLAAIVQWYTAARLPLFSQ